MKSKKFTYFLGLVVLVVWGVIIYRLVGSMMGEDDERPPLAAQTAKHPYNDYQIPVDTTRLLLNYRDPFGLVKQNDTIRQSSTRPGIVEHVVQAVVKRPFDWGFIKYSGFIKNPTSKKLVAIVLINGKTAMMAEGETSEQVRLVKNMQDSIKVVYNGKTAFIKMRSDGI